MTEVERPKHILSPEELLARARALNDLRPSGNLREDLKNFAELVTLDPRLYFVPLDVMSGNEEGVLNYLKSLAEDASPYLKETGSKEYNEAYRTAARRIYHWYSSQQLELGLRN